MTKLHTLDHYETQWHIEKAAGPGPALQAVNTDQASNQSNVWPFESLQDQSATPVVSPP